MIRSEPLLPIELDDSLSVPKPEPGSLLMPPLMPPVIPLSMVSIEGIVCVSAGRATGRLLRNPPPPRRDCAAGLDLDRLAGFRAELLRAFVVVRALLRFAGAFFFPPEREAVERFAVLRLDVDFLAVDFLAVDRLLVDFFVDFFFAAIDPPCMRESVPR